MDQMINSILARFDNRILPFRAMLRIADRANRLEQRLRCRSGDTFRAMLRIADRAKPDK